MKQETVLQLNALNERFYRLTAEEFTKTRSFYWKGWKNLVEPLTEIAQEHPQLKVLDLGCGNGRFGEFLWKEKIHKDLLYHAGDNSQKLLEFASEKLASYPFEKKIFTIDLIRSLLDKSFSENLPQKKYHVITLFGVLHHVPSQTLRYQLIETLADHLVNGGVLIFTAWRFLNETRFRKKQLHPTLVGIDPEELEKNDHILDWQRGVTAYRYCHYTDETEMENLTQKSGLELVKEYTADGKSGNLNTYRILKKP